jgi:hypothetical protein
MRKTLRHLLPALTALILAAIGAPAFAQSQASTPYPVSQYYAAAFAQWSISLDSPNTYIFQGRSRCNAMANNVPFFTFATNAPVYIQDQNPTNSEVKTPSAVQLTAGTCGVTIAPSNSHYTAWLRSGTGGLQEAINNVSGQANSPAVIVIDRNWYSYASQVPGTTPQAIILAAAGSAYITVQDITTAPNTFYTWNGAAYAASSAPAGLPFNKVTSYTNIAVPTALTTVAATCLTNGGGCINTATTGGTIPTGAAYRLGATCVDSSGGETTQSIDTAGGAVVTTGTGATNSITVTSPAGCTAALGAVGWRLYMSAASGASLSEILYSPTCTATQLQSVFPSTTVCAIGSTATVTAIITGTATIPTNNSAYPRTSGASGMVPPFAALGALTNNTVGTMGTVNLPAGYLNTLGRAIQVCGAGYATGATATGTLTLATTLASVPGVTSITPFTAISGATAGSTTQVPFDFCVTYTTAATGASGTLEAHGVVHWGLAGSAVDTPSMDFIYTVSSTVDLTKQDQLAITIKPTGGTITTSAAQLRQVSIIPIN